MNGKVINFIKNFSYTLGSNLISFIISTLVTLIVPKLIGVEEYGYWQLYIFYSTYIGILQFGWNDGIYLRYGGKKYAELDKKLFFSQFFMMFILQVLFSLVFYLISVFLVSDFKLKYILRMLAISSIIVNLRSMLIFILQATNRIKEYARSTIIDKILYCFLIILFLILGVRQYYLLIMADLIGKLISLIYTMSCCRDIVYCKLSNIHLNLTEVLENVRVGSKLMFANATNSLIIGVVRFGIERSWDITTFGKVSLTLSISNLMMLFINSVGIIIFPVLRRTDSKKLSFIYTTIRDFLMIILLGILLLYYPIKVVLSAWLPQYADSLMYMSLIFPMSLYEGKMVLLINTYLKTLREERAMLRVNILSLILSLIITLITSIFAKNLTLAILSIVVVLAFRCIIAEIYLSRILNIKIYKDIVLESIMSVIFIYAGWYINSWASVLVYIIAYLIYLLAKKEEIIKTSVNLKYLLKA